MEYGSHLLDILTTSVQKYADVIWNNRQAIDVTRLLPAFSNGN